VGGEQIRIFVDGWAILWTALLLAGYVAEATPWPGLSVLRGNTVARYLLLSTSAAVLGLTLAGAREPSAILAAWGIITTSVKLLYDWLVQLF
jgi:hypothetical protein